VWTRKEQMIRSFSRYDTSTTKTICDDSSAFKFRVGRMASFLIFLIMTQSFLVYNIILRKLNVFHQSRGNKIMKNG